VLGDSGEGRIAGPKRSDMLGGGGGPRGLPARSDHGSVVPVRSVAIASEQAGGDSQRVLSERRGGRYRAYYWLVGLCVRVCVCVCVCLSIYLSIYLSVCLSMLSRRGPIGLAHMLRRPTFRHLRPSPAAPPPAFHLLHIPHPRIPSLSSPSVSASLPCSAFPAISSPCPPPLHPFGPHPGSPPSPFTHTFYPLPPPRLRPPPSLASSALRIAAVFAFFHESSPSPPHPYPFPPPAPFCPPFSSSSPGHPTPPSSADRPSPHRSSSTA
jgi:hypothetical protein